MSIFVMAPVLKATMPDLAGDDGREGTSARTLKLVALALADSANDDGTGAFPGVRAIARYAECHTDTVVRALRYLIDLGAITQTDPGGPGRRAAYTVHVGWFMGRVGLERDRRSCPPLRGSPAQGERAGHPRKVRGSDPRKVRGSDPRSYVHPSVTSSGDQPVDNESGDPAALSGDSLNIPAPEEAAAIWRAARLEEKAAWEPPPVHSWRAMPDGRLIPHPDYDGPATAGDE